ncbi:hypothetical protein [Methylobacterium sp. Leaf108]|uniref:hypothetical protein n=1 Tax=Methylobacterium sp. Leaf108 TaxID=1736256 RepID=UPI0012E86655|nr:hypothetical protein [Methylobacterium sp. Leaf108]
MPRITRHIRRKPASNLHHAIRVADALKLPLNTFVTINISMTDCPVEQASFALARLRNNYFSHWARRPTKAIVASGSEAFNPAFVWVLEAAGGVTAAHWLLHVPEGRREDFETRLVMWVEKAIGKIESERTIEVKDAPRPKGLGKYMLKGMEEAYAHFYGIDFKDQGVVLGRRSGYSLNLGPSAKQRLRNEGAYPEARMWKPFPRPPGNITEQALKAQRHAQRG